MTPSLRPSPLPGLPGAVLPLTTLLLALTLPPAHAADTLAQKALAEQMKALLQRMQQLEQRNQELERKLQDLSKAAPAAASAAAPALPGSGSAAAAADPRDTRLETVERQQQSLQQQVQALARPLEAIDEAGGDGPKVEGSLLAVGQRVNGAGSDTGLRQSRLNYRGDLTVSLPGGFIGDARGTAFGQLRFGQGGGVALRPTHTGTVNSTTFEAAAGSDQTYAVVAQAWYQLAWPLDGGRFNNQAASRVEMTVGKLDLFGFFDQNAVAADEGAAFLNNVFVHNPLLDSGGDIGADSYGFAPGLRVGYFNEGDSLGWGVSMGVFAAGSGATLSSGPSKPLVITQFQVSPKQINGEPRGNYRLYAWGNGRTTDVNGVEQRHSGYGVSADQRVGREWNLFGRYGQRTQGSGAFDRALTLGFEHGGRAWGRGRDAAGLAVGWLNTSSVWRDATADGSLVGYSASGAERITELYYRIKLNQALELTPDFQLIQRAGGDSTATTSRVFGLRAKFGF